MSKQFITTLPQAYKHQKDTRTQKQKYLSNQIVRGLTQLNLNRMRARHEISSSQSYNNKYFFICLTGLPRFDKQFQNLQLPGQKIIYTPKQFSGKLTHQQYDKLFKQFSIQKCSEQLSEIVNKIAPSIKIVLLFHSFGSYVTTTYINKYGSSKISGYIDIGGIPITFFQAVKKTIQKSLPFDHETLFNNSQFIYDKYLKEFQNNSAIPFPNKYDVIFFMKFASQHHLQDMFEWARNCNDVVKLIIYGKKDEIFSQNLLTEKAIHYCYNKKFKPEYQKLLKQQYKNLYGVQINNVQQRFIIQFQDGKHSVHMQSKFIKDINIAIKQYIKLIDIL